jgi:hypothetical protein
MKFFFVIFVLVIIIIVGLLVLKNVSLKDKLSEALKELPDNHFTYTKNVVGEEDLISFPDKVQRYMRKRGMVGKPLYKNAILHFKGDFKMAKDKPWIKVNTQQYNSFIEPVRLFLIRADIFGLFSMVGSDIYKNGHGHMKGKLLRLITIFNEKGEAFDIGELTTYLNDAFLMFPWALIHLKERLVWEESSSNSLRVRFTDHSMEIRAELHFDDQDLLINYITDDRFLNRDPDNPKKYLRTRWSTPIGEYKEFDGQLIPTYGQAIWHYDDVEFCYAKFRLKEIEFDVNR